MEANCLLDKLEFLITESFKTFRRNGLMTFAAISTVAISMFLLGGLGYTYYRVNEYAQNTFPHQFTMEVFLKKGTTYDEIKQTAQQLRAVPGVESAVLIPKEKAYPKLLKDMNVPGLAEDKDIPIQDKFDLVLSDISEEGSATIASQIENLPTTGAGSVRYMREEQRFLDQFLGLLRLLGSLVGALLFATAGILIYNAIRLTIVSRRLEIRVMQLVGASRFTIQVPFLFEGVFQGAIGGTFASLILLATYKVLAQAIIAFDVFGALPDFPLWPIMGALAAAGALYGFFSSFMALSSPLRYR